MNATRQLIWVLGLPALQCTRMSSWWSLMSSWHLTWLNQRRGRFFATRRPLLVEAVPLYLVSFVYFVLWKQLRLGWSFSCACQFRIKSRGRGIVVVWSCCTLSGIHNWDLHRQGLCCLWFWASCIGNEVNHAIPTCVKSYCFLWVSHAVCYLVA